MASHRILIVEDEGLIAEDLAEKVERLGHTVVAAVAAGEEAVAVAEQTRPDMLMMDIRLRGTIDGIEAARRIRERLHIPVVFLTAYSDEATLQRAKTTDPFGFLIKPVEQRELNATIAMAVHKHEMDERVRKSEERFHDLFDNVSDLIQSVAPDGSFHYVNPAWRETLGYSEEEIPALKLFDIIHPDSRNYCDDVFHRLLAGEKVERHEVCLVAKDGRTIWVEGSTSCRFEGGRPTEVRGFYRDITERRRVEIERTRLIAELQQALNEVETLRGLIHICSSCKKIRDEEGSWHNLEDYMHARTKADFSHDICPECGEKLYGDHWKSLMDKDKPG